MGGPKWDQLDYAIRPERARLRCGKSWGFLQTCVRSALCRIGIGIDIEA
jgi:hypothetical protein